MKKILTVALIVLACGLLIVSPFLIKVKIDCRSQYGECPNEINTKLQMLNDKSLSQAKSRATKILKNNALITDFSMQFKLPNILQIEILVKKAAVAMGNSKNGPFVLVDKDGVVIATSEGSALPLIITQGPLPNVGRIVGSTNLFALNLVVGLYQMYQIRETSVHDGSLLVELPGQIRVIFPLEGDTDILLGSLRLIYTKIQADGNPLGYSQIDLRFRGPVLR